jgi:hypothetical protein
LGAVGAVEIMVGRKRHELNAGPRGLSSPCPSPELQ